MVRLSHKAIVAAGTFLISGCSSMSTLLGFDNDYSQRMNPPRIHVASETGHGKDADANQVEVRDAEVKPFKDYYEGLKKARENEPKENDPNYLNTSRPYVLSYVDQGIGLVKSHCLRWLQRLNDEQRLLEYANASTNVITELGTTLLGLGSANSVFVTAYGGYNTARSGLSKNFNEAFLLAPNAKKVKSHIFSVLDEEGDKLLQDARDNKLTFKSAYVRLERYADVCTHSTAREIIETALDQTNSKIDPQSGGKIKTTATDPEGKQIQAAKDGEIKALQSQLKARDEAIGSISTESANRLADAASKYQESLKKALGDAQAQVADARLQLNTELKRRSDADQRVVAEKLRADALEKRLADLDAKIKAEQKVDLSPK